ncbi:MAG: prepilin-type N-terminal cleavage/methylation domain-containing protein [Caulobacteraceae bacterium]|nr:prepilin-type N-terminal cleavage/methylation domain-containing protein [Caulobacteraceae bacterium]
MPRACWTTADGFTLVELLASLAVLAMLSLMLVEGVSDRSLAWSRVERDTTRGESVEAVRALISERVTRIWPLTVYNILPAGPDFDGEASDMTFLAPPPEARAPAPLERYQLVLAANGDLLLNARSDVALDQTQWSDHQVLMHGVRALDLSYFGAIAPGGQPDWRPDWSQRPFMPSLIRIRLSFAEGDRRRWPDLIVHPMADIDTGCQLTTAAGCRGR